MRTHEPAATFGVALLSRVKQADAFAKMSRSQRTRRRFSRRGRIGPSRLALGMPSLRVRTSRSACLTKSNIDRAPASNSRESYSGV